MNVAPTGSPTRATDGAFDSPSRPALALPARGEAPLAPRLPRTDLPLSSSAQSILGAVSALESSALESSVLESGALEAGAFGAQATSRASTHAMGGDDVHADEAVARALASLLPALSSPEVLFAAIERAQAQVHADGLHLDAEDALRSARAAEERRTEARASAAKAARRARRALASAPKWVRKLVKAILVVASAVAAVCTGGVGAALAIAGLVLSLAAPKLEQLAVKLGLDPSAARWVGLACRVAGAALAAGAGGAAASSMLAEVAHVASVVRDVVAGASSVVAGAREIAGAQLTRTSERFAVQETREALAARFADEALSDVVTRLRALVTNAERVARAASEWLSVRDATRHALASSLG